MDDVGMLAGLEHEFEGGAAEKCEPGYVVVLPVDAVSIEEILARVRFDEVALASMDEPEQDGAGNAPARPRHPQILEGLAQPPDVIVAHAVVFRHDDFDGIAANLQLAA